MLSVFSCAEDYLASSYTYVTRIDFCFYTSVTLRATCNNKGDNSLLTKPWIKVPKRSRIEYNRGKPASIIEQALLMPHLYAIYTHGNNDAKITKDIIHSRAYRMKGGVLTYKPFPFVAQKTDFWLNHFIFPDFFFSCLEIGSPYKNFWLLWILNVENLILQSGRFFVLHPFLQSSWSSTCWDIFLGSVVSLLLLL